MKKKAKLRSELINDYMLTNRMNVTEMIQHHYFAKSKVPYFKFPEKGFMPYIAQLKNYLIEAIKGLLSGIKRFNFCFADIHQSKKPVRSDYC